MEQPNTSQKFLSVQEAAEHLGITRQAFTRRELPTPDALIGKHAGWLPETLEQWDKNYPKPGRRWAASPTEKGA